MIYTKHIAGEFKDMKQNCVICGLEICNYEHAMWEQGSNPPQGWPAGEVYISSSRNPTIFLTTEPAGEIIVDCE